MSVAPKRIRRTPEEARRVILDAAESVIARNGPGGLRLQEVAEAAGVSHPTILHHFESREGLMKALNRRTLDNLGAVLSAQMNSPSASSGDGVRAAFAAYRGGFAERIIWLLQTPAADERIGLVLFEAMVDSLHRLRTELAAGSAPPRSDSEAIVHLITIAAFGDAVLGPRLRGSLDPEAEIEARARFEQWLGELIRRHIGSFLGGS